MRMFCFDLLLDDFSKEENECDVFLWFVVGID